LSLIERWADGYYHPGDDSELSQLLRWAAERDYPVRIRGAAHSEPPAIYSTPRLAGRTNAAVDIMLDRMAQVSIDQETQQVTVQAGCHFGLDPWDPAGRSTEDNGPCAQLDAA
ncbi:unnamed protein product, partial [Laminaria digitata]